MTFTVEILQQHGALLLHGVELPEIEREGERIYLQPIQGEPKRVDLVAGDSIILTVEPKA